MAVSLVRIARQLTVRSSEREGSTDLPQEVDALLDHEGGLAKYHRDNAWRNAVTEHYEHNLRRMVRLAREADVPILLINPTSNVRDIVPFKAKVDPSMPQQKQVEFHQAWNHAKSLAWDNLNEKRQATEATLDLDPGHAEAWYLHAKVLEAQGDLEAAKLSYLRAKDEDVCPLRMTEEMHAAVLRVALQTGTPLVDVRKSFDSTAEGAIPGDNELIDHVHPRIEGHQQIADLIYQQLVALRYVREHPGWEERRQTLYHDNYALLPSNYFPEALSRLEGLNRWARGRVGKIDGDAPPAFESDGEERSKEITD